MGWNGFIESLEFVLKLKNGKTQGCEPQGVGLSENLGAGKLHYSVFVFHRSH